MEPSRSILGSDSSQQHQILPKLEGPAQGINGRKWKKMTYLTCAGVALLILATPAAMLMARHYDVTSPCNQSENINALLSQKLNNQNLEQYTKAADCLIMLIDKESAKKSPEGALVSESLSHLHNIVSPFYDPNHDLWYRYYGEIDKRKKDPVISSILRKEELRIKDMFKNIPVDQGVYKSQDESKSTEVYNLRASSQFLS